MVNNKSNMNESITEAIQTLSKEVNKRIHACKECGGEGVVKQKQHPNGNTYFDVCTTCQGDGYMIQRKTCNYGCSVKDCKNHNSCSQDKKKYGARCMQCSGTDWVSEDITLQDILLVLKKENRLSSAQPTQKKNEFAIWLKPDADVLYLDLTKTPQEWDDETIEAIIKLIK